MPKYKITYVIDDPNLTLPVVETAAADIGEAWIRSHTVNSCIWSIKKKGHTTKKCKCQVFYDGYLMNCWGILANPNDDTIFDSLSSAKDTIKKLGISNWGGTKRNPKLYKIVKV